MRTQIGAYCTGGPISWRRRAAVALSSGLALDDSSTCFISLKTE